MAARDQLIEATADLMRRHGVAGTAVSDILEHSGVARRSIYLNFPGGKSELMAAATRSSGGMITALLTEIVAEADPIMAFADMWSAALSTTDFEGGCPVVAAALGRLSAPEAAAAAADVFDEWRDLIERRLRDDGIAPEATASLATTIVAAIEGAVVLSEASQTTTPLIQVATHLNELVAVHRAHPGGAGDR
ncbi:TetR/AcrR family transcriptional regulator [Gordonia sp. HS-NH1]|uniref:TetR/AcrR family transcriptional regulator n=1 Tax=Gordonia sp. HS-NH1 TaxID=1435068 RepID=UPI0006E398CC|nr:helix-turn-helix domain-containing protein [Gordonia sp. HS-NH1]